MTEDDVRALLNRAVPDLPDPPDPVDRVRRRAARVRGGRIAAAAATAVVLVLVVIATIPSTKTSEPAAPMPAPGRPKTCVPPDNTFGLTDPGGRGQVVPEGATRVTLCTYTPDSVTAKVEWTTSTATAGGDLTPLIDTLNGFQDPDEYRHDNPGVELACTAALFRQYQMIFDYPTGGQWSVVFDMNCGTVTGGDVIRHGNVSKAIKAFTTLYSASGGSVAPPT
ncbi:hypothetical protein JOD54_005010 [Actinokineospora baliensis]|uniref:hypothetical protein n=1 Tax=Actinokineospora baliensis TaxID=547056 RepID=UPI001957B14B|nr:hypothetical protein [Actinokineospora baliensis]MBM7774806.1 hypothetical protein [Actinokineospora baliensis]